MEKLDIGHVILYSKNWYAQNDIINDLRKCLTCDGYSGELFSKQDIIQKLLSEVEKLEKSSVNLSNFFREIQESRCWIYGYHTIENTKFLQHKSFGVYDQETAVIYWALSQLRQINRDEFIEITPDYDNCLPMSKGITPDQLQMFNKK